MLTVRDCALLDLWGVAVVLVRESPAEARAPGWVFTRLATVCENYLDPAADPAGRAIARKVMAVTERVHPDVCGSGVEHVPTFKAILEGLAAIPADPDETPAMPYMMAKAEA